MASARRWLICVVRFRWLLLGALLGGASVIAQTRLQQQLESLTMAEDGAALDASLS